MTSVIFAAPRHIEIREEPHAAPGPGQVRVAAEVSAISAGTELLVYRGQAPSGMQADSTLSALAGDLAFPLKFGYSLVGRVVETGPEVSPDWRGQRVFAFHPHESMFVAGTDDLTLVPDDIDAEAAIFLPNVETAVNLLHDGRPLVGERVGVFGQGIVGLLTTALLQRLPLEELVTVDPVALRRTASLRAGAHRSVAPETPPRDLDLVYEVSGHPATLDQALAATGFCGRVVVGSWYGTRRAEMDLGGAFHRSRIHIMSSQVSTVDPSLSGRWTKKRRLDVALALLRQIGPQSFITHRFPVQHAARAYALLDERPQEAIQAVLTYGTP